VKSLGQVDLAVWVVDVTEPYGAGDRYVREVLRKSGRPVVLAINKIDRVPRPKILAAIDQYRGMLDFREVVPISARDGENVDRLASLLLVHLPEGERLYPEDFLTDLPERFFVAEMVREKILEATREEVPYSVAVVIDSWEEGEKLTRIEVSILVEKDSQKGILVGRRGSMAKAIGTAARKDIEAFLGSKVFLGIHVRVRPDWRENPRLLSELGID
jgi:GTP-binding protein Era